MIYPVFAIRDFKTGFLSPVCEVNEASARRNFEAACMKSDSLFFSHPADYVLYEIGVYNADNGTLEPVTPVREVITAPQAIEAALAHSYMKGATKDGD